MKPYFQLILAGVLLIASYGSARASPAEGDPALSGKSLAGALKTHHGKWLGDMKLQDGRVLKIGAELFTRADGSQWASFASPDQAAYDMPVKKIVQSPGIVELDLGMATLKMTWSQDHFDGAYAQNGPPIHFKMPKVREFPRRVRPQTPNRPSPYIDRELALPSAGGVMLGATLSIPRLVRKPTAVVLVAGSGPIARDGGVAGHQAFLVIADYLARQGVAVLRYDKRGVGRSTGDYEQHTIVQLEDDLQAALSGLRASNLFGPIGVIGISEGPAVAAAVAARDPRALDFIVSMAGTGVNGLDLLLLQDRLYAADKGAQPADIARLMDYVRKYYQTVLEHEDVSPRIAALKKTFERLSVEDQALVIKYEMNQGTLSIDWAAQPALRASLLADPTASWGRVSCPVLVLYGGLDHQVPAEENERGLLAALEKGGNKNVEAAKFSTLNHMFQTAHTGSPDEYENIEETIAPAVLARIARFVLNQQPVSRK